MHNLFWCTTGRQEFIEPCDFKKKLHERIREENNQIFVKAKNGFVTLANNSQWFQVKCAIFPVYPMLGQTVLQTKLSRNEVYKYRSIITAISRKSFK